MHAAPHPTPHDALSPPDFERIAAMVQDASGIRLPAAKRPMLEGRLRRLSRSRGMPSLADYCRALFAADPGGPEHVALLNAVTTNKTEFFRERRHFDHLAGTVLPQLGNAGVPVVRAWSAGCSIGAEPYSIAMLLDDQHRRGGPPWRVQATDLDTEVLAVARRGIYPAAEIARVPAYLAERCINRHNDPARAEVRIAPHIRSRCAFGRLNLMQPAYPADDPFHIVFCRNVLIYFDRPTQELVVRRLAATLLPGGHLYLGHSESIAGFDVPLVQVGHTVFRKVMP